MRKFLPLLSLLASLSLTQAAPAGDVPGEPAAKKKGGLHRLCDRLHRHSCGYGKTHHDYGCTGFRGEMIFIFGSCWEFFEEPCFRQPPPPRWATRTEMEP